MNINDCIHQALGPGQINDLLLAYYRSQGSESFDINDAEYEFLIIQGASRGSVQDMWFEFLRGRGYVGTVPDMLKDFWCIDGGSIGPPANWVLLINGIGETRGGGLSNSRATPATVIDHEGLTIPVLPNEIRFQGARRVENLTSNPVPDTGNLWIVGGGVWDNPTRFYQVTAQYDALYSNVPVQVQAGDEVTSTFWIRGKTGGSAFRHNAIGTSSVGSNNRSVIIPDGDSLVSFTWLVTVSGTLVPRFQYNQGDEFPSFFIDFLQMEVVTGKSDQTPSEQISPILYNAGVPGVQYFDHRKSGAIISPAPQMLHEPAGTDPVTGPRDADAITMPLVLGSNFNQAQGMMLMEITPQHELTDGPTASLFAVAGFPVQNLLYLSVGVARVYSRDSGNNTSSAVYSPPSHGQMVRCAVLWDTAQSERTVGISINRGAWAWATAASPHAEFTVGAENLIRIAGGVAGANLFQLIGVSDELIGGSVASAADWVEAFSWRPE